MWTILPPNTVLGRMHDLYFRVFKYYGEIRLG